MGNAKSKVVSKLSDRSATRQRRDLADLANSHEYLSSEGNIPERCFSADDILSLNDDASGYSSCTRRFPTKNHNASKSTYNIADQKPKKKRKYLNFKLRKHRDHNQGVQNSNFNLGECGSSQPSLHQSCDTMDYLSSSEYLNLSLNFSDEALDQLISKILTSNQRYSNEELFSFYCAGLIDSGKLAKEDLIEFSSDILKHTTNFSTDEMVTLFLEPNAENHLISTGSQNVLPSEALGNSDHSTMRNDKARKVTSKFKKFNPISKISRFLRRWKLFSKKSKRDKSETQVFSTSSESVHIPFSSKEVLSSVSCEVSSKTDLYTERNQSIDNVSFKNVGELFPSSSTSQISKNESHGQQPTIIKNNKVPHSELFMNTPKASFHDNRAMKTTNLRPVDEITKISSTKDDSQRKANETQNRHDENILPPKTASPSILSRQERIESSRPQNHGMKTLVVGKPLTKNSANAEDETKPKTEPRKPTNPEKVLTNNKTRATQSHVLKQMDNMDKLTSNSMILDKTFSENHEVKDNKEKLHLKLLNIKVIEQSQGAKSVVKVDKTASYNLEQIHKTRSEPTQDKMYMSNNANKKTFSEILQIKSSGKSNETLKSTTSIEQPPSNSIATLNKNLDNDKLSSCQFPVLGSSKSPSVGILRNEALVGNQKLPASTKGNFKTKPTIIQHGNQSSNNLKISKNSNNNSTKDSHISSVANNLNYSNNTSNNAQGIGKAVSYSSLFKTSDNNTDASKTVQIIAAKNKIKENKISYILPTYYSTKVCPQYNSQNGCYIYWCFRFHVCYYWILGRCTSNNCKKYHSFQSDRNEELLGRRIYSISDEALMYRLKRSTFHWKELQDVYAEPHICISYLKGRCNNDLTCKGFHINSPYSWQIFLKEKWIYFSRAINAEIELNYCNPDKDLISFCVDDSEGFLKMLPKKQRGGRTFLIEFDSMTLITESAVSFTIRRLSTVSDVSCNDSIATRYLWLWQDNTGKWNLYRNGLHREFFVISVSDYIEFLSLKGETNVLMSLNNRDHILDLENLLDTDVDSKKVRKMRTRPVMAKNIRHETLPFADLGINETATVNLSRKLVPKNTLEFTFVQNLMTKSLPIIREVIVGRIENVFLWRAYQMRKQQMLARYENNLEMVNEQYLFHGTKYSNVDKICEGNFDWRLYGSHVGNIWGKGTYFANSAYYSDKYTSVAPNGYNCMFIALVLVGTATKGNPQMDLPPVDPETKRRFDSTVNKDVQPEVFVKYNMDEYYPVYFVQYK